MDAGHQAPSGALVMWLIRPQQQQQQK